jgi:enoyl-[acyl-carrier protein] reductase III
MSDVQVEVQGVFAEVTRYPLEILDPAANLEQDLGIDSVKLGEVLSVLRERFHLPQDLDIGRESLMTIAGVSTALAEFLAKNGKTRAARSRGNGSAAVRPAKGNGRNAAPLAPKTRFAGIPLHQEPDPSTIPAHWGKPSADPAERFSSPQGFKGSTVPLATRGAHEPAPPANRTTSTNGTVTQSHYSDGLPVPRSSAQPISLNDMGEIMRDVFATVTRYPKEILDPNAGLEEDLGIDSVKLGEVFSVLRERFGLPSELEMPRENLGSISAIAASLHRYLADQPKKTQVVVDKAAALPVVATEGTLDIENLVIEVFAEVTRYPKEILDPAADLEQDLGIDSVKLGEVFSVLRERYRLPEKLEIPRERLHSIREIAAGLSGYVGGPTTATSASAPGYGGSGTAQQELQEPHTAVAPAGLDSLDAALYSNLKPTVRPFTGKVVFISGSGRGLGKDIAEYLAELGASVVVNSFHSRNKGEETAEGIRNRGGDAIHLWGSMANPEHVDRVFNEIETHYGCLDFFVGNASNGMLARLEDITAEHWEKAYRTNVIGLHQSALRAVKLMQRRGGGKILTLSSPAAHGYVDYFGCMGAVKAAVESLTRSMAIEFAPYNIQVNCVSPGPVYGELLNKWPDSERLVRQWEDNTAYDRLCNARDVSHFIGYLLSEPVKLFTGSVLIMDGGISSQGW